MNLSERKRFIADLVQIYLAEKENDNVWQRENSSTYYITLGKLLGFCTAFGYEYEESNGSIIVRSKRAIVFETHTKGDYSDDK